VGNIKGVTVGGKVGKAKSVGDACGVFVANVPPVEGGNGGKVAVGVGVAVDTEDEQSRS
jgi:hypothetical protein